MMQACDLSWKLTVLYIEQCTFFQSYTRVRTTITRVITQLIESTIIIHLYTISEISNVSFHLIKSTALSSINPRIYMRVRSCVSMANIVSVVKTVMNDACT